MAGWIWGVALAVAVHPHSRPGMLLLISYLLWSPVGMLVTWQMQRLNRYARQQAGSHAAGFSRSSRQRIVIGSLPSWLSSIDSVRNGLPCGANHQRAATRQGVTAGAA